MLDFEAERGRAPLERASILAPTNSVAAPCPAPAAMPAVGSYVGGVLIALATTALSAAGLTLQKLAHTRRAAAAAF